MRAVLAVWVARWAKRDLRRVITCWRQLGTSSLHRTYGAPRGPDQALCAGRDRRVRSQSSAVKAAIGDWLRGVVIKQRRIRPNLSSVEDTPSRWIFAHNRNESLRDDHRDDGRSSVTLPRKAVHFVQFRRWGRLRASRAWALCGCEMGCRGFLRGVCAKWHR